jgi:ribose-phosphate pyrophosphokinase
MKDYVIMAGTASFELGNAIARKHDKELIVVDKKQFSDGEIFVKIEESIRGKDVYYVQSTSSPANDNLMELLLTLDAIKRSSPGSITLVMPYFGYARQDRKTESRVPISAKLVADLIERVGINRLVTLDIHADQIQGFFDSPVDNLYGVNIFIASPDAGGVGRARYFAKKLNINDLAIIDKRREKANESEVMNVIGSVEGKHVVIIDDMVDTGGTLIKAAKAFKEHGAVSVKACITHGVLSGNAFKNFEEGKNYLDKLYITNSIEQGLLPDNIEVIDSSDLFAEVIRRLVHNESISSLWR